MDNNKKSFFARLCVFFSLAYGKVLKPTGLFFALVFVTLYEKGLKPVGLFIWDFLKRVGNVFVNFYKFVISNAKGPSFQLYNKKIKEKDPNKFVFWISLIASILLFVVIRGFENAINDITSFFNMYIFIPLGIGIILTACFAIFITKKKYTCIIECIFGFIFPFAIAFIPHEANCFVIITEKENANWFIYLVMSLPYFICLFSMALFVARGFIKIIFGKRTPEREQDFAIRTANGRKIFNKIGNYFKHNWGQILVVIALIVLAVSVLLPLVVLITRSLKFSIDDIRDPYAIPTRITFDHYTYMWDYLKDAYFNSLITTFGVTIGTVILASLLAFAFVRFKWPAKNVFFYAIIGLMMIPGILTLISRYQLVSQMNMLGSLWGIILPGIAGYIPAGFMLLYTFFQGIPRELFEAADVDGTSDIKAFLRITVPLSKPILWTIGIQTFVGEWNDYLWASLIIGSNDDIYTLPVYLKRLSDLYSNQNLAMSAPFAGYVLSAIPLVLIFVVASKQFIEGLTSGAFKM